MSDRQAEFIAYRAMIKPIILKAQGGRCKLCGTKTPDFRGWELSHIIPLARGGSDDRSNLEVICGNCHAEKRHNLREA
jgi:5-methylcytosine-specific restriction endonuclease McrA